MLGNDDAIEEDAHRVVVGPQVNGLAHHAAPVEGMRHRVGVGIEMHACLLRHDHGHDEIGVEGVLGERAQACFLDEMPIGGALTRCGVNPRVGDFAKPLRGLCADVLDALK